MTRTNLSIYSFAQLQRELAKQDPNPNLQQLILGCRGSGYYGFTTISSLDLSNLVHGKVNLKGIRLRNINVTGNLTLFTEALTTSCRHLVRFTWILQVTLPVLQNPNNELGTIAFVSNKLHNRVILPAVQHNEQLNQFLRAGAASTNLVHMRIDDTLLGSSQLKAACDLVGQPTSSLEALEVSIARDFDLVSLLGCLKVNQSIKDFRIGRSECETYKDTRNAFRENKDVSKLEAKMLLDVLQHHNRTLEVVIIPPWMWRWPQDLSLKSQQRGSERAQEKARSILDYYKLPKHDFQPLLAGIYLFLDLNKEGRHQFLTSSSWKRTDCINYIAKHKDDLPVLFYYLQQTVSSLFGSSSFSHAIKLNVAHHRWHLGAESYNICCRDSGVVAS